MSAHITTANGVSKEGLPEISAGASQPPHRRSASAALKSAGRTAVTRTCPAQPSPKFPCLESSASGDSCSQSSRPRPRFGPKPEHQSVRGKPGELMKDSKEAQGKRSECGLAGTRADVRMSGGCDNSISDDQFQIALLQVLAIANGDVSLSNTAEASLAGLPRVPVAPAGPCRPGRFAGRRWVEPRRAVGVA